MTIADANSDQIETVTVTLSSATNGSLAGNYAFGSYNSATGIYSLTGSASAVSSALDELVFQPSKVATTAFTIKVSDSLGLTTADNARRRPPPVTLIESVGNTSLAQVGNNYFLYATGTSSGPELYFQGAPVNASQIGNWTPIGAEQTASGYEVAWKVTGANQYTIWNTDSNGAYTTSAIAVVSGSNPQLEAAETLFQQDLNGDGHIGLTVIQADGQTTLATDGTAFTSKPAMTSPADCSAQRSNSTAASPALARNQVPRKK